MPTTNKDKRALSNKRYYEKNKLKSEVESEVSDNVLDSDPSPPKTRTIKKDKSPSPPKPRGKKKAESEPDRDYVPKTPKASPAPSVTDASPMEKQAHTFILIGSSFKELQDKLDILRSQ